MDRSDVILDMAALMVKNNLHKGASTLQVLTWCRWAVSSGHVEYVYDGDEMIGFMDWIRSTTVPINHNYQSIIDEDVDSGDVAIALNCCVVRGKDTLRKLIRSARAKTQDCQMLVWHNRKHNKMMYFTKEGVCKEIAVC